MIYGLEYQARSLAPCRGEDVSFFLGTQTLKANKNQIHLIEVHEEENKINANIFPHDGEIWKLNSSPHNKHMLTCCYSKGVTSKSQVEMRTSLLTIPEDLDGQAGNHEFAQVEDLKVESSDIKTTEFHHTDERTLATLTDNKIILINCTESEPRVVAEINSKQQSKFTNGKWSLHHEGSQFIALNENTIKSYDVRCMNQIAWTIEDNAHSQIIRDLDCNPNKQCHLVTGADDGSVKIWDFRSPKQPVFAKNNVHSHWIQCVRFNTFHDQLIISSSTDAKVKLLSAFSVSSDSSNSKETLPDGPLETFHHDDSVYCVEWSAIDPFLFCSLSFDGRLIVSKVPKDIKYKVLL